MLNTSELEQRWLRYKIKSYLPHVVITLSLITITTLLFFFLPETEKSRVAPVVKQEKIIIEKVVTKAPQPELSKTVPLVKKVAPQPLRVTTPSFERASIETHSVKLEPSLGFMKKMQHDVQPYYKTERQRVVPKEENRVKKEKKQAKQHPQKKPVVVEQKKEPSRISIRRQNTQSDIYEIIQRFKKNNNPALSLFVAKKYYELGNYKQAYNYALITNDINKNIESSWLIFAKSLVKLGKRKRAMNTLEHYIQNSQSNSARILLDEIRSGKFK